MKKRMPEIVLVEDNRDHAEIYTTWAKMEGITNTIRVFDNGEDALKYLKSRYKDAVKDVVVLLDLKLRGLQGIDVLREMRQHPGLRAVRVMVLSFIESGEELQEAVELGVWGTLSKNRPLGEFSSKLKELLLEVSKGGSDDGIP